MWGFFTSLLNTALGWIFRAVTIKFVLFTALVMILAPLTDLLLGLIDETALGELQDLVGSLPNDVLFYMLVFRLDVGIPLLVGAMIVKFFIRRLPFVG